MSKQSSSIKKVPFYFLRHGQTEYNKLGLYTGSHDIPLNQTGIEQAQQAAQLLYNTGVQVIACSPLKRALQTAHVIAQSLQIPIVVIDNLKEASWGMLEGAPIEGNRHLVRAWNLGEHLEGAQSREQFKKRVKQGLEEALRLTEPVLIVAHGGVYTEIGEILKISEKLVTANCLPTLVQPSVTGWETIEIMTPAQLHGPIEKQN